MTGGAELLSFMLKFCQHARLKEWSEQTRDWCEWQVSSSRFLLGCSHLCLG